MKHLVLIIFLGINFVAWGQHDDITYHQAPNAAKNNPPKKTERKDYLERISIGGMGGLQVGPATYVEIEPNAAYHFNKFVCVGVGGSYMFFHDNYSKFSSHVFGANAFAEGHFFNYLGLHAAYQAVNYDNFISSIAQPRIWSNHILLGGGYYQRAGRTAFYFYVLYNLSDRPLDETIYASPLLFKMGVSFFLK